MPEMRYAEALNQALREEMQRDPTVLVFGEDVGEHGGVFKVTQGLRAEFGPTRVLDTPTSEIAIAGAAVGAAMVGARPVAEFMFVDFMASAMDQVANQAAKMRYLTGGQVAVPLVFRTQGGAGGNFAAQHSQSLESWFCHIPGLKVVMPSTPKDAKGLLKSAIRDDDPVVFIEHKLLYATRGWVPEDADFTVPLGVAEVVREGTSVSVIATGRMVRLALEAAVELEPEGIDVELIDPRTLIPLDVEALSASLRKTGRLVVVQEAPAAGSMGPYLIYEALRGAFDYVEAPVQLVSAPHTPAPYSPALERHYVPDKERIKKTIREVALDLI